MVVTRSSIDCLTQCVRGDTCSGVLPGNYGMPLANGFPDTFCGTMTMALELGLEKYSEGVMNNWLKYCASTYISFSKI